jgi:hypothetical protein
MDVTIAATILAGTILTGISICIVTVVILIVNNLFHKYWKPIAWRIFPDFAEKRFVSEEELDRIAPEFEKPDTKTKK